MVEGASPQKQTDNCDVKDERVLNGGGSKELELSNLPPYSKTNPNLNCNKKVIKEYDPLQDTTSQSSECQKNVNDNRCWDIRYIWKSVYSNSEGWSSNLSKVFSKLGRGNHLYSNEDKTLLSHQKTPPSYSSIQTIIDVEKVSSSDKADFERAIELTEYGKFHYLLLAICGFVSTSEEMDVISMSFILPAAQCDLDLNTQTKGWLNSIIFIGMMCGAYGWGSMADAIGRKKVLIASSFMNALCIVASSFSQSYEWFMLFRFLNGAALGGSGPVIWPYFAEFQPKSKRGSMLSFMAAFWTLGNLFVAGLAWLIIPADIDLNTPTFIYNSWRIFLLVMAVPSFIVGILLCFLPESPKYLLTRGKSDQAIAIFKHIYHINTGNPAEEYPVKHLIIEEEDQKALDEEAAQPKKGKYMGMLCDIVDNTKDLFVSPILKFTLISITINFTFHIGYYGLMMWFPEMFNRFDAYGKHSSEDANVCEVTNYVMQNASLLIHGEGNCKNTKISQEVFMESLITVAAALPANVIAVLGMDRLGRKFFMIFSTLSSGTCAASMYFVRNKTQNLAVSATFSSVISCGNAALDCLITEIFPTNLRATGIAISMVSARLGGIIGNIVIATLLDMYCPAPTFIVAGLLIAGGLMCLFLPNTTKEPLA